MVQAHAGTCDVCPAKLGIPGVQLPARLQHFGLIGDEGSPARDSLAQGIGEWGFILALLLGQGAPLTSY